MGIMEFGFPKQQKSNSLLKLKKNPKQSTYCQIFSVIIILFIFILLKTGNQSVK